MNKTLIIVRTHRADTASLAAYDLFETLDGFDVVFCIDERAGPVDMQGRATCAYDEGVLHRMGLYAHPNCGWRCGDYCYAVTKSVRPSYDFYWLIEPDVRINTSSLQGFFAQFESSTADYLAPRFGPRDATWIWSQTIRPLGLAPYGGLFPVSRMSARAIDHVYALRRSLSAKPAIANPDAWPNDESLAASALMNGGFTCSDLNDGKILCHSARTLATGAVVDYDVVTSLPPDEMIYHPVRDFGPWLDEAESRIAQLDLSPTTHAAGDRLRAQATFLSGVARACQAHPLYADAALVPLLLARDLWARHPWNEQRAPGSSYQVADENELAVCTANLDRGFGVNPKRPWLATAFLVARLFEPDRLKDVRADRLEIAEGYQLGRFPERFALPLTYDMSARAMIFTAHVRATQVLAAADMAAAQRETARVVITVGDDQLVQIFGAPSDADAPILILSPGHTLPPDVAPLFEAVTNRFIREPESLSALADAPQPQDSKAQQTALSLAYYALVPFLRVHLPGPQSRAIIQLGHKANRLAGPLARGFPKARFVVIWPQRRDWAQAASLIPGMAPAAAAERLAQCLGALRTLRDLGLAPVVVKQEDFATDPAGAMARLLGKDALQDQAVKARLDQAIAGRLPGAGLQTPQPAGGSEQAAWLTEFNAACGRLGLPALMVGLPAGLL
jgi:hypothetical protein